MPTPAIHDAILVELTAWRVITTASEWCESSACHLDQDPGCIRVTTASDGCVSQECTAWYGIQALRYLFTGARLLWLISGIKFRKIGINQCWRLAVNITGDSVSHTRRQSKHWHMADALAKRTEIKELKHEDVRSVAHNSGPRSHCGRTTSGYLDFRIQGSHLGRSQCRGPRQSSPPRKRCLRDPSRRQTARRCPADRTLSPPWGKPCRGRRPSPAPARDAREPSTQERAGT